ncbi:hypothetical protein HG531_011564 [Fusarium graminearum]|nr:hypothetical protein HG531_011564 [Fusarium graminearum]
MAVGHLSLVRAGTGTEGGDEVNLLSNLGLDVVREPVAVVAGECLAARHGSVARGGPHLLDVVLVVGVDDSRDVEVSLAVPATEGDLTEHTRLVLLALLDSVEVTDVLVREGDGNVLATADGNGLRARETRVRSEDDGALLVIKSLEGDSGSGSIGSRGNEANESGSELHFCGFVVWIENWVVKFSRLSSRQE